MSELSTQTAGASTTSVTTLWERARLALEQARQREIREQEEQEAFRDEHARALLDRTMAQVFGNEPYNVVRREIQGEMRHVALVPFDDAGKLIEIIFHQQTDYTRTLKLIEMCPGCGWYVGSVAFDSFEGFARAVAEPLLAGHKCEPDESAASAPTGQLDIIGRALTSKELFMSGLCALIDERITRAAEEGRF